MADQGFRLAPRISSKMRTWLVIGIVSAVIFGGLAAWLLLRVTRWKLAVRTCLEDADGLREGAKVRLAGVDVGYVRRVRVQPQDHTCPAAVEMALTTDYELKIPRDSLVSTATAGFLGETFLKIDSSHGLGDPIGSGGQLPSKRSEKLDTEQIIRHLQAMQSSLEAFESKMAGKSPVTQNPSQQKKKPPLQP